MKKQFFILTAIILTAVSLHAQDSSVTVQKSYAPSDGKNIIKLNVLALALKSVTVQYERAISKKSAVALSLRLMPKGGLPLKGIFRNAIDDEDTRDQVDDFKIGNFALMPEIRFYLGRKGVYHGFYIAPFFSYAHYTADIPFMYDDNGTDKTMPLSGSVNTITGGLMFGAQWKIGKMAYLDWWIFGPHYGSSDGNISGRRSLSSSEQTSLKDAFDDLDIPLTKTSSVVDANGATLNFNGPWGGIRSGLCIGIRF